MVCGVGDAAEPFDLAAAGSGLMSTALRSLSADAGSSTDEFERQANEVDVFLELPKFSRDAALRACSISLTGGVLLADDVGLGKTSMPGS